MKAYPSVIVFCFATLATASRTNSSEVSQETMPLLVFNEVVSIKTYHRIFSLAPYTLAKFLYA